MKLTILIAAALISVVVSARGAPVDWPNFNRTLTAERFSPLRQVDTDTVKRLKVLCTYDTHEMTAFQTGLLQVNGSLYWTTEHDTFSVDPNTCHENWRTHEEFPSAFLPVSRGAAYLEGRIFRGTNGGQVLAYDANTGKRLWATTIADPGTGELVSASAVAWKGLVFIGNSGGDVKGVKGRMFALDAATGKIVWEFFLVPRTKSDVVRGPLVTGRGAAPLSSWKNAPEFPVNGGGTWTTYTLDPAKGLRGGTNLYTGSVVVLDAKTGAYRRHFQLVKRDFHDWDVSSAPSLFTDQSGRHLMAVAPKDGHLYAFDLVSGKQMFRLPVTTIANADTPLTPEGVRFCPGSQGGAEWNGPAFDPDYNTILTGEVDWCTTVHTDPKAALQSVSPGQPWSGSSTDGFGKQDDSSAWAGWLTATDATTGAKRWQFKAPFPLMSGITPTAGKVVFFGDMGGNFYALNVENGNKLWSTNLGGAVAGGVITYDTGDGQRIAVATGMTSPIWPTSKVTAKVAVLGLE
jgi:alcohol dehydrogenase (cytochrome c)